MELPVLLHFVRTYKWLIGGAVVLAAILAAAMTSFMPPTYTAEASVVVGPRRASMVSDYDQLLSAQAMAGTYANAAATSAVAERVIERVGLSDTPEQLLRRVTAAIDRGNSTVLAIQAEDPTPDGAAQIANAIADDLIASSSSLQGRDERVIRLVREQNARLRTQIASFDRRINRLKAINGRSAAQTAELDRLQTLAISARETLSGNLESLDPISAGSVAFLDRATPPAQASSPRVMVNVLVAAMLGLVLGLAAAAVLRVLDDRIKTGEDVRTTLAVPLLGAVGYDRLPGRRKGPHRLVMQTSGAPSAAEAFRSIRTSLEYSNGSQMPRTLLVTSPDPHDGKSTVAANIALAFAQAGRSTLLVDADLRSPSIHRMFDLDNTLGLSTYLGSGPPWPPNMLKQTATPNLRILPSGPMLGNPADLLGAARAGFLLRELDRAADLIVIDSPSLQAVTDASLLAAHADASVLVLRTGRTRRGAAIAAMDALQRVDARLIGVVLNRRDRGGAAPEEPSPISALVAIPSAGTALATRPETSSRQPVVFHVVVNILDRVFGGPLQQRGSRAPEPKLVGPAARHDDGATQEPRPAQERPSVPMGVERQDSSQAGRFIGPYNDDFQSPGAAVAGSQDVNPGGAEHLESGR